MKPSCNYLKSQDSASFKRANLNLNENFKIELEHLLARRENQAQRREKAAIEAEISKNVEKYRKSDLHKLTSLLKKMRVEFEGNTRFKQAKEEECRFFKNEVKRLKDQLDFDRKMHKLEIENNGHVPYGEQNQIYNDNELLTKTDDNLAQSINNYMLVFLKYTNGKMPDLAVQWPF